MARRLRLSDFKSGGDEATNKLVRDVAETTGSKRELAKVMEYCNAWNGPGTGLSVTYSVAVQRAEKVGGIIHVEGFLPKSWRDEGDK